MCALLALGIDTATMNLDYGPDSMLGDTVPLDASLQSGRHP
jgi:hypothetical protein